jgi:hypothetical protein
MPIDMVYPGRSPAIGDKFELKAGELQAMKARGGQNYLEDNFEILPRQFLVELSRIHRRA